MILDINNIYLVALVMETCSLICGGSFDDRLKKESTLYKQLHQYVDKQPNLFNVFDDEGFIREWICLGLAELSLDNLKDWYDSDISDFYSWAEELNMEGAFIYCKVNDTN